MTKALRPIFLFMLILPLISCRESEPTSTLKSPVSTAIPAHEDVRPAHAKQAVPRRSLQAVWEPIPVRGKTVRSRPTALKLRRNEDPFDGVLRPIPDSLQVGIAQVSEADVNYKWYWPTQFGSVVSISLR